MKLFDQSVTPEEQQLAWYVDREEALDYFARQLQWKASIVSNVVVYHGPGGIGKSTIRKMAENHLLKPAQVPYVVIDYEPDGSPRSCERTFSHMRRQLGRLSLKFPAFDLVWARHWEQTTQQRVSRVSFPSELEDAADIISLIPLLGNIPQAITAIAKLSQSTAQWISERFDRGGIAQLKQMDALELLHIMPEAIARDLEEMMEHEDHRGRDGDSRITVIFDGFERLGEHGIDDWFVREFCRNTGSVLKVILGREALDWECHDQSWGCYIEHYPALGNLRPCDSAEYLARRDIDNPDLRHYLIELTNGYPYHLRLAADLCQQIEERTGREPTVTDFASAEQTSDLGEALLSSLLRQLRGDERDAATLSAIPRWFTQDMFEILLAEPASASRLFDLLIRFSFCEKMLGMDRAYMIRKEARQLLRHQARESSHWLTWNKRLHDYHTQYRASLVHLAEELYHGFIVEPEETLESFKAEFYQRLNMQQFGECLTLLEARPPESELSQTCLQRLTLARATLLQEDWRAKEGVVAADKLVSSLLQGESSLELRARALRLAGLICGRLGDPDKAVERLNEAVSGFSTLGDRVMTAAALRDAGFQYFIMGNYNDALRCNRQALDIVKHVYTALTRASTTRDQAVAAEAGFTGQPVNDILNRIASSYARTGRVKLAIKTFEAAVAEGVRTGDPLQQAAALSELGLAYRRLGHLEKAKIAYQQALPLFEELGHIPGTANVHCGLGMTLEQSRDFGSARPHYQEALQLFEELGDRVGQAKLWFCFARIEHENKNVELATQNYNKALQLYRETGYFVHTAPTLMSLAKLKATLGEYGPAIEFCKVALGVFEGLNDQVAIAAIHANVGFVYYLQNELASALRLWERACTIYRKLVRSRKTSLATSSHIEQFRSVKIEDFWVNWLSMYEPSIQKQILAYLAAGIAHLKKDSY